MLDIATRASRIESANGHLRGVSASIQRGLTLGKGASMFYWKFSDGTTVYSYAQVEGDSRFAQHLRQELTSLAYGCGPLVWLTPGLHAAELDPTADELLALWLEQEAKVFGLKLTESDFEISTHTSLEPGRGNGGNQGQVTTR